MSRISRRRQLSERRAFWIPLLTRAAALVIGLALPRLERSLLPDSDRRHRPGGGARDPDRHRVRHDGARRPSCSRSRS
ncbi:MAG: hypothetical protein MZV64_05025 [Ignavibacteriales bacterium]|nr:hypothetical protein [Ignavibacteriales bacterium]